MAKRRRTQHQPEWRDLGTPERQSRGEIVVIGEGRNRSARTLSVISSLPIREMNCALMLIQLGRSCAFSGYALSNLQPRTSSAGTRAEAPPARAEAARKALHRISKRLAPIQFAIIFYCLLMEEQQSRVAIRLGVQRREIRPLLMAALTAAANARGS